MPHNEGIDACRHFLNTRDRNALSISTETLCDLISMILTMNNFSFNSKHYLQTRGTAMGTSMTPSYANLFLPKFETDALTRASFQPFIWWRYMDDIFMIWTRSIQDLNKINFLSQWHSLHNEIYMRLFFHTHTLSRRQRLTSQRQNRHRPLHQTYRQTPIPTK